MNVVTRVAKNSFVTIAAKIICLVTSLLTLALVARYLDTTLFGEYVFVMAFVMVFEVFTDLGYNATLVREMVRAKDQLDKILGTAVVSKCLLGLFTFLLMVVSVNLLGLWVEIAAEVKTAVYVLGFAACSDFFVDITVSTARAHEKMEYEALLLAFNGVTSLLFIAVVTWLDLGFVNLFSARFCSIGMTLVLSLIIFKRQFGTPRASVHKGIKHLARKALPFGMGQVIERFYTRTNFFLVRIIHSATEVGLYGGAYRVMEQSALVSTSIVGAVFPIFSVLSESSRSSLALAYEKTLKLLVIISLPAVVVIGGLSKPITLLVFGSNLIDIHAPLRVLSFGIFLGFSNVLFKFTFNAMNRQVEYRRNMLIAFSINLLLALFLIPPWGHMGACVAYLASSTLFFLLGHLGITKRLPGVSFSSVMVKPLAASLLMMLVVMLMKNTPLLLVVPCAMLTYVAGLIVLGTFGAEELNMLRKAVMPTHGEAQEEGVRHA